jgi:hypothetical protein
MASLIMVMLLRQYDTALDYKLNPAPRTSEGEVETISAPEPPPLKLRTPQSTFLLTTVSRQTHHLMNKILLISCDHRHNLLSSPLLAALLSWLPRSQGSSYP